MHTCKNIKFIRWGSLSQKKGRAISAGEFHKAPADFGLYAFPQFLSEDFLVNWKYSDKIDKIQLININNHFEKNYKEIDEFYYDNSINLSIDEKIKFINSTYSLKNIKNKDFKVISYKGRIWHHFINESKSPIRKGSWVLDNYDDYTKILNKILTLTAKNWKCDKNNSLCQINNKYAILKYYSKDEFEVYLIDKIK